MRRVSLHIFISAAITIFILLHAEKSGIRMFLKGKIKEFSKENIEKEKIKDQASVLEKKQLMRKSFLCLIFPLFEY